MSGGWASGVLTSQHRTMLDSAMVDLQKAERMVTDLMEMGLDLKDLHARIQTAIAVNQGVIKAAWGE